MRMRVSPSGNCDTVPWANSSPRWCATDAARSGVAVPVNSLTSSPILIARRRLWSGRDASVAHAPWASTGGPWHVGVPPPLGTVGNAPGVQVRERGIDGRAASRGTSQARRGWLEERGRESTADGGHRGVYPPRSDPGSRPQADGYSGVPVAGLRGLPRVLDGAGLPHHRDLHLPRVLHVLLDAVGDVTRQQHGRRVVDPVRLHDDADLAPGLDGEGVLDPGEASGDVLQALEPLDVALERLAPRSRTGRGDGIGRVDDDGVERLGPLEVVVVGDGVDDLARLAEAPAEVGADLGVRSLDLAVDRLADVVKQAGAPRHGLIDPQLGGDDAREVRHLHRVLEDVLAVARAELQAPEQLHQAWLEADHGRVARRFVTAFADVSLHVVLRLLHDFLDARRVDAPVGDQLGEGELGDLAADGVEARQQHRLRRVVDDQVDTREGLEGADVAALAADDAPLHGVVGDRHHRHGDGGRHLGSAPLDGLRHDVVRLLPGFGVGLLQRGPDAHRLLAFELAV